MSRTPCGVMRAEPGVPFLRMEKKINAPGRSSAESAIHSSRHFPAQAGIATVRCRSPLPRMSAMTGRPCASCSCSSRRPQSSNRRSPQPASSARMARSRTSWMRSRGRPCSSSCTSASVSQVRRRWPRGRRNRISSRSRYVFSLIVPSRRRSLNSCRSTDRVVAMVPRALPLFSR